VLATRPIRDAIGMNIGEGVAWIDPDDGSGIGVATTDRVSFVVASPGTTVDKIGVSVLDDGVGLVGLGGAETDG
jgi:hypothetical protein